MILEKNKLQTVQEWTKSYIELIALYVLAKNSNHLRSQVKAITVLGHSRLGLVNKFLENKSGRIFWVRQVYFTKSWQQIWGVLTNLSSFLYIKSEVKQYYEALFVSYRPLTNAIFTILQYKLHSLDIEDDRSTRGLLAGNRSKYFQNHLYGQSVLTFNKRQIRSESCPAFEQALIELRFNIRGSTLITILLYYRRMQYSNVNFATL